MHTGGTLVNFTAQDTVVVIAAVSTMLVAVLTGIAGLITAWKNSTKIDTNIDKTVKVEAVLEKVHDTTNSNYAEQKKLNEVQSSLITGLKGELEQLRLSAALNEQTRTNLATVTAQTIVPPAPTVPVPVVESSLIKP